MDGAQAVEAGERLEKSLTGVARLAISAGVRHERGNTVKYVPWTVSRDHRSGDRAERLIVGWKVMSLARALQNRLAGWWLLFGIDTLITGMPQHMFGTPDGHTIHADGSIGSDWSGLPSGAWTLALVGRRALVRAGANVILDEVFLDGAEDQERWRHTLEGSAGATGVGPQCDVEVAAAREAARGVLGEDNMASPFQARGSFTITSTTT